MGWSAWLENAQKIQALKTGRRRKSFLEQGKDFVVTFEFRHQLFAHPIGVRGITGTSFRIVHVDVGPRCQRFSSGTGDAACEPDAYLLRQRHILRAESLFESLGETLMVVEAVEISQTPYLGRAVLSAF